MGHSVQGDTQYLHVVLGSQPQAVPSWGIQSKEIPGISILPQPQAVPSWSIQSKEIPGISILSQGLIHRPSHHGAFSPRRYPGSPSCLSHRPSHHGVFSPRGCPESPSLPEGLIPRPSHHAAYSLAGHSATTSGSITQVGRTGQQCGCCSG